MAMKIGKFYITRNNPRELLNIIKYLKEENQKLKNQLEEIKNEPLTNRIGRIDSVVANIYSRNRTRQKEFIEWIDNLINNANKVLADPKEDEEIKSYVLSRKFVLEHILSKYKEIIGGKEYCVEKDENANQINVSHNCKYINLLNEYQNWLAKEKEVVYRDCGHTQKAITKCYDKLVYLRKIYKDDYDIG